MILCSQGYGFFLFLWQFVIPLVVFVVAYWKILAVVRHQAKVAADRQRSNTEPVAGTSAGTAAKTASGDEIQRGRRTVGKKSRGQAGGKAGSNSLSQAQLNDGLHHRVFHALLDADVPLHHDQENDRTYGAIVVDYYEFYINPISPLQTAWPNCSTIPWLIFVLAELRVNKTNTATI